LWLKNWTDRNTYVLEVNMTCRQQSRREQLTRYAPQQKSVDTKTKILEYPRSSPLVACPTRSITEEHPCWLGRGLHRNRDKFTCDESPLSSILDHLVRCCQLGCSAYLARWSFRVGISSRARHRCYYYYCYVFQVRRHSWRLSSPRPPLQWPTKRRRRRHLPQPFQTRRFSWRRRQRQATPSFPSPFRHRCTLRRCRPRPHANLRPWHRPSGRPPRLLLLLPPTSRSSTGTRARPCRLRPPSTTCRRRCRPPCWWKASRRTFRYMTSSPFSMDLSRYAGLNSCE